VESQQSPEVKPGSQKPESQEISEVRPVVNMLWKLYSHLEKTDVDNALREFYNITEAVNQVIVKLVATRPPEPIFIEKLGNYESIFSEIRRDLITNIRLKRYFRAKVDILKLIDLLLELDRELAIHKIILKPSTPKPSSTGVS